MNNLYNQLPFSGELKFSPYRGYYVGTDLSKLSATEIMMLGLILAVVGFCY